MPKPKPAQLLADTINDTLTSLRSLPGCALAFSAPIQVVSEANQREHWGSKLRRKKGQQLALAVSWPQRVVIEFPCVVCIHRIGMSVLDDDNLANGCKGIRDEIARKLAIDDGDARIKFVYSQEPIPARQYAVIVAVFAGLEWPRAAEVVKQSVEIGGGQ